MKDLQNKKLSSDKVATMASIVAKDKKIRKLVHAFQKECYIILQRNMLVLV